MKHWQLVRELGKGSFGRVFLASPENEPPESATSVAVKVAGYHPQYSRDVESLKAERGFLAQLKGLPNIVQCFGEDISLGNDNSTISYGLLLEYATEGSLHGLIEKAYHGDDAGDRGLSEDHVACYTRMLLRGLVGIHSKGIIHCDLKPENILVFAAPGANETGKVLKIADFGLAKRVGEDADDSDSDLDSDSDSDDCYYHRGTPPYSSPESVEYGLYEPCMDTWSLGCVVYEMLTGTRVWREDETAHRHDLFDQILNGSVELDNIQLYHSKKAADFLEKCLEKVPQNRWSPVQLLKHPFIIQNSSAVEEEEERFCPVENPFDKSGEWVSTRHLFTKGMDAEVKNNDDQERPWFLDEFE